MCQINLAPLNITGLLVEYRYKQVWATENLENEFKYREPLMVFMYAEATSGFGLRQYLE
jgi:hypothetical protein